MYQSEIVISFIAYGLVLLLVRLFVWLSALLALFCGGNGAGGCRAVIRCSGALRCARLEVGRAHKGALHICLLEAVPDVVHIANEARVVCLRVRVRANAGCKISLEDRCHGSRMDERKAHAGRAEVVGGLQAVAAAVCVAVAVRTSLMWMARDP